MTCKNKEDTFPEEAQNLHLQKKKAFQSAITNMFKELKKLGPNN